MAKEMTKLFGKLELILGLLLITYASYLMVDSTLNSTHDPHGFVLMIAIFGASIGGLMAFAGAVCVISTKYRVVSHLPLVIYTIIATYTFGYAYN